MGRKSSEAAKILDSYLASFPDMPDKTLARLVFKENGLHFNSIEIARSMIRAYRGHHGELAREKYYTKHFKPLTYNTAPFKSPESVAEPLKIFRLPKDRKSILFLTDLHLPYHDAGALDLAINYGKKNNVDTVWFNGDVMDMYQASTHDKNPSHKSIQYEFDVCRAFLKDIRKHFPKAVIYYKEGNHETRWARLLKHKAPEIFGNPEFELPSILRLAELDIHWIANETLTKFGKLNVLHGNEFKGGGGVNPARSLYLKAKDNVIAGDKHKTGENTEGSLNGNIVTAWAVGCLCNLNPQWLPMAHVNWCHGFAHVVMDGDDFQVRNYRIYKGKIR